MFTVSDAGNKQVDKGGKCPYDQTAYNLVKEPYIHFKKYKLTFIECFLCVQTH